MENLNGFINGRLTHIHRLETTLQGRIPLNMLAVLIQGRRTDALQLTPCQCRLQDICRIDRPFSSTRPNQGVHLVNHQNDVPRLADLIHDLFQAFLKLTAILGTRNQQTNIQGHNPLLFQNVGHIPLGNPLG